MNHSTKRPAFPFVGQVITTGFELPGLTVARSGIKQACSDHPPVPPHDSVLVDLGTGESEMPGPSSKGCEN